MADIVVRSGVFNYVGEGRPAVSTIETFLQEHLLQYETVLEDILAFLDTACNTQPAVWFTIRISKCHENFAVPRWHRDGRMWRIGARCVKYVQTLIGPDTLLLPESPLVTDIMAERNYEERRNELAEKFANVPRMVVDPHSIISFTCGENDSQVHSEPNITEDRVFISAVPGSVEQLQSLASIRDWTYISGK